MKIFVQFLFLAFYFGLLALFVFLVADLVTGFMK